MTERNKLRTLRLTLMGLFLLLGTAIVASPASAATSNLQTIDGSAVAMVIGFGGLLFAIVFEIWRMTLSRPVPVRATVPNDDRRIR